MKYSIITPCGHNDLKRIHGLLQSLAAQKSNDFEWIVACDDSQLNLKTPFPSHQIHFSPTTVGAARNAAIKAAHGDYLIFVDADDYLLPGALTALNRVLSVTQPNSIFDLNVYKTYEPMNSALETVKSSRAQPDFLPAWGGRLRTKPQFRFFDYQFSNRQVGTNFRLWLQHRYWVYDQGNRYFQLGRQLALRGKVIPRQLLIHHQLKFNERNPLYPNVDLMLKVTELTDRLVKLGDYYYVRVKHNDPINDPSLSQLQRGNRWQLRLNACLRGWLDLNDQLLMNYFAKLVVRKINTYLYRAVVFQLPSVENHVTDTLVEIQKFLQLVDTSAYDGINVVDKRTLLAIRKGDFKLARQLMATVVASRNVHKLIINHGRGITKDSYLSAFKRAPINSHVILYESFLGRSYSDNPKYIYQYIQKHYPGKFTNVWIADADHLTKIKRDLRNQPHTKVIRRFGFKYMYYLATAKYFVFNMRQPKWFIKRPGMRFLETWHGTPLKQLVFDMNNVAGASHLYKKIFYHQSRQWDHLLTDNQYSYDIFNHAFMYPKSRMVKSGYPRNDILSNPHRDQIARRIKQNLGIPLDKKVILYAPTWRDNQFYGHGRYKYTLHLKIAKLKRYLSDQYVLILRTHYFITNHIDTSQFGSFVYNESNYDDIAELYLISDLLITDYSSVFFDYAILKRPILYYVYDYYQYAHVLHGFYLNMQRDLPGPLLKTSDEVLSAIQNIDSIKKKYASRYVKFNHRFNSWDDGHAAARAVKILLNR